MEKTMSKSDYRSKYHRSELENADGEISEKELTAVIGVANYREPRRQER